MRALIVGGGVAGPALALFLRKLGTEASIYEARSEAELGGGAFLTLAPNGMHVLDQLGLKPAVEARGVPTQGMRFSNTRGELVGTIDNSDCVTRYGSGLLTIERAALQGILHGALARERIPLQLGKRLSALTQSEHGVCAQFEDGTQAEADVLIGCDGLRSRVRNALFPKGRTPHFTGLYDFGGMTQATGDEPLERGWFHMVFGRRAFFGALLGERGEIYWFHNGGTAAPADTDTRSHLLQAHRQDPAFIGQIIERTAEILGPWPQHDILSLPQWHQGRVCLVGDAAHATTPSAGQGASLALEDALLLARCLREEPATAFARFQTLRQSRVERIVKASRHNGSGKAPATAAAAWFRDRMLSTFLKFGASAQHEAIGYRADLG